MSYKDIFSITEIKLAVDQPFRNLKISCDIDNDVKFPVILFTPYVNKPNEHFHIELTRESAIVLKEWLDAYIEDTK
jgi:hypothetical protein